MKKIVILSLSAFMLLVTINACSDNSYPCPGNGQMKAADLSLFDEDGNPMGGKKKRTG